MNLSVLPVHATPTQLRLHEEKKAREARRARFANRKTAAANSNQNVVVRAVFRKPDAGRELSEAPSLHIKLWKSWQAMTGVDMTAKQYMECCCFMRGVTVEEMRGPSRQKWIVQIRFAIMQDIRKRFPDMSLGKVGELFDRDHSCVHNALYGRMRYRTGKKRTLEIMCRPSMRLKNSAKLMPADVVVIRKRLKQGERTDVLAEEFKVTRRCISQVGKRKTWRHIP